MIAHYLFHEIITVSGFLPFVLPRSVLIVHASEFWGAQTPPNTPLPHCDPPTPPHPTFPPYRVGIKGSGVPHVGQGCNQVGFNAL